MQLDTAFRANANPETAAGQKAYMRDQFDFIGLRAPMRKELQKSLLSKESRPDKAHLHQEVKQLWSKKEREFQYAGQELAARYWRNVEKDDLQLFEFMTVNKSWWDTVDFIAANLVGNYFKEFPDKKVSTSMKWVESENIWLQRSALLFQLKYKTDLDTDLLTGLIKALADKKEFFIEKAIGWILREYSKVNPKWVIQFCEENELSKLSRKEALKRIEN